MTWVALSLYALGVIGAVLLDGDTQRRDVAASLRKWVVLIGWPAAIAVATCLALVDWVRRERRR